LQRSELQRVCNTGFEFDLHHPTHLDKIPISPEATRASCGVDRFDVGGWDWGKQ
jgi:hypothetical protein